MAWGRRVVSIYAQIARVYLAWAPSLLLIALVVFLPLGLLEAIVDHADLQDFKLDSGFRVAAVGAAIGTLAASSLLGAVFYSGVVGVLLVHPEQEPRPRLAHIARHLDYGRLIAVDILFVLIVIAGLLLAIVPGVLAYIWLGLAGPVVEIERRGVFASLRRSAQLVRRNFWLVAAVVVPIELLAESVGEGVTSAVGATLGDTFVGTWLADSASEVILTPLLGVATVLLTLRLNVARDGTGPKLNPRPSRADAPAAA